MASFSDTSFTEYLPVRRRLFASSITYSLIISKGLRPQAFFIVLEKLCKSNILSIVNGKVNRSSRLSAIQVLKEPFEKTATRKHTSSSKRNLSSKIHHKSLPTYFLTLT